MNRFRQLLDRAVNAFKERIKPSSIAQRIRYLIALNAIVRLCSLSVSIQANANPDVVVMWIV